MPKKLDDSFWNEQRQKLYTLIFPHVIEAGQDAAEDGIEQLPSKAVVGIDMRVINERVRVWAENYTYNLIRGITDTNADQIGEWFSNYAAGEFNRGDLFTRLNWFFGPDRANMIATTEITRAYATGNRLAWLETGIVQEYTFNTAGDDLVDQDCADVEAGNPYPITDTEHLPPLHVNCRCYIQPIVIPNAEAITGVSPTDDDIPSLPEPLPFTYDADDMPIVDRYLESLMVKFQRGSGSANPTWTVTDPATKRDFFLKETANYGNDENEIIAKELGDLLGLDGYLIPVKRGGRYILMPYLDGFRTAYETSPDELRRMIAELSDQDAKSLSMFDWMFMNHDRHMGNWMLNYDEWLEGKPVRLVLIDNGGGFGSVFGGNQMVDDETGLFNTLSDYISDTKLGLLFTRDDISDWIAALSLYADGKTAEQVRLLNQRADLLKNVLGSSSATSWTMIELQTLIRGY